MLTIFIIQPLTQIYEIFFNLRLNCQMCNGCASTLCLWSLSDTSAKKSIAHHNRIRFGVYQFEFEEKKTNDFKTAFGCRKYKQKIMISFRNVHLHGSTYVPNGMNSFGQDTVLNNSYWSSYSVFALDASMKRTAGRSW